MRFQSSAMASARPLAASRDGSTEAESEGRDRGGCTEGGAPRGPVRGDDMGRISRAKGFTLLELMIVVAIIGILATTAIAGFRGYQLRSKFAEGKTNISSIRTVQNAYYAERNTYVSADPSPALAGQPDTRPQNWRQVQDSFASTPGEGFDVLGWAPEGAPFFDYQSATNADGNAFTLTAIGDTDGDGHHSAVMYVRPAGNGDYVECTGACGDVTVPWDPNDCSIVFDEVAQVLSHDDCEHGAADDY